MTTNDPGKASERINQLAVEATQTFIDAAYLAQRQSAQLLQAWLNTLDAGQKEQRDIAARIIKQSQEAQRLLQQYVQESSQAGMKAFTQATGAGLNTVGENFQRAGETVKEVKPTPK